MQAPQGVPKRAIHRWTVLAFAVALIASTAMPALANHDWASGCNTSGNSCWWETGSGGYMQSDHGDDYMSGNKYVGDPSMSLGWDTDYVKNKMNSTHAHYYKYAYRSTELFCVNPGSSTWQYVGSTTTHSWNGHSGSLGWCRS